MTELLGTGKGPFARLKKPLRRGLTSDTLWDEVGMPESLWRALCN
jgi:hypothetical protein